MTGLVLDAVLMLLLVAALGYGVRLDKRLRQLREGQLAFASAVTELNQAAGRAEAALASLRAAGHETDLLHDRIVKARELKAELEGLTARTPAPVLPSLQGEGRSRGEPGEAVPSEPRLAAPALVEPAARPSLPMRGRENPSAVLQALAANHAAQQSLNRARASLDADLFAA